MQLPPYTFFDPNSRPQSYTHDLMLRFLVDVGTLEYRATDETVKVNPGDDGAVRPLHKSEYEQRWLL